MPSPSGGGLLNLSLCISLDSSSMIKKMTGKTKGHNPGTSDALASTWVSTQVLLILGGCKRGKQSGNCPAKYDETRAGSLFDKLGNWSSFLRADTVGSWKSGFANKVATAGR